MRFVDRSLNNESEHYVVGHNKDENLQRLYEWAKERKLPFSRFEEQSGGGHYIRSYSIPSDALKEALKVEGLKVFRVKIVILPVRVH